jgi:hypothetical protein
MSETAIRPRARAEDSPFGSNGNFGGADLARGDELLGFPTGTSPGTKTDGAQALIVTATRVPIKRDMARIVQEARAIGTAKGNAVFYHWETKNKDGSRGVVEGPSIVGAMIAAQIYGNCRISALVMQESATHWIFGAEFVDAEKGFTVQRQFQQRKEQNLGGKMDRERQLDIVFQIGQSKAMRNAIVAALRWLCDEMIDAAKDGLIERISAKPDGARAWLVAQFQRLGVDLAWVERVVSRKVAQWTVPDMARMMAELKSVEEGFTHADDIWPSDAQRAAVEVEGREQPVQQQQDDTAETERRRLDQVQRDNAAAAQRATDDAAAKAQAERQAAADEQAKMAEADAKKKADAERLVDADKAAFAAKKDPKPPKAARPPDPRPPADDADEPFNPGAPVNFG